MAEHIICLVILLICAAPFLIIGIVQRKSKKPVGFWSGKEPPAAEQVTDLTAYNRKHGRMWIAYGAGLPLSFALGGIFGGAAYAIAMGLEVVGGLVAIIWYHNYLDRKYVKKRH